MISIAAKNSPFTDKIKASNARNVQQSKSRKEKQANRERGSYHYRGNHHWLTMAATTAHGAHYG